MTDLIDINLTISGPGGCGKTRFIKEVLPMISTMAETFFDDGRFDTLITATESNTKPAPTLTLETLRAEIKKLKAIQRSAEDKMDAILNELTGTNANAG